MAEQTFIPPKAAQQNAKRALAIRAKKPESQRGMTDVGLARARDLSNGKALSLDTVKRMKAYFDRHAVDKKGATWKEQGKGWQAWNGWGGDEARAWVERVIARVEKNFSIHKVSLVDMVPAKLKIMGNDELLLTWLRLNQWHADAARNKEAVENYINAARWVMAEFERRNLDVERHLPLALEAAKLNKQLVEARFNNLPNEMVVVNDFINVVGSVAADKENPSDLDLLVRSYLDNESNMMISAENAWLHIRNILDPNKQHSLQFIFNPQGGHSDYLPMYDLVLRKRPQLETRVVKGAGFKIEDFKRGQIFEITGDKFSDKGPATGTIIDVHDEKIVVEFDEPQTFEFNQIRPYLERFENEKGWRVTKDFTIQDVHVPTVLTVNEPEEKEKPRPGVYIRRNLLNAQALHDWAKEAGIKNLVPPNEMHVTQVYSQKYFEVISKEDNHNSRGGVRAIKPLGDKGAVVLMFEDIELSKRWDETRGLGASWEYESGYHPHVTLSYDAGGIDVEKITPPTLDLEFGPEIKEDLNVNWAEEKGFRKGECVLKVEVLDVKSEGGDLSYLGGLTPSRGNTGDNVAESNVALGWTLKSDIVAQKGDVLEVPVTKLISGDNKLTWLGATVSGIIKEDPHTIDQALDLAKEKDVLQKEHGEDLCFFCEHEPDKAILWAGASSILYVCDHHMRDGVEHVMFVNRDKVNSVIDINGQKEYNAKSPSGINISVSITKKLETEGDITRESEAGKFWDENWDKLYPENGKGKFVYQHHWRGLSEEETKLSDSELLNTNHSLHGDLRLEANDALWGFTAFIGTAKNNKNDKLISATQNIRGNFKLAQPKAWLNVGVRKPFISEPGGAGATNNKYAVFHALDTGEYELGVRNRHFVEIFLKGGKLKGRYTIVSVPANGGRVWNIIKPENQTPYAESHNLDDEIARLKKEGHKKLLWAGPGIKPKLIDLSEKVEKELSVHFLKAEENEKRLVTGIVLEPDTIDAHNDTVSAEEIEKAAFDYMRKSQVVGDQHSKKADSEIVESYIAPVDFEIGGQKVKKGSWVMTVKILCDEMWNDVKAGKYTGFSIGGYGLRQAAE